MEMKVLYAGALFFVGWMQYYLFGRQLMFNFVTAFPLISAMQKAQKELIVKNAVRYTVISVFVSTLICGVIIGIIIWLCPLYLKIAFFVGVAVSAAMYANKLSPKTRSNFDAFCGSYYRFVPDDELRTLMYKKNPHQMKVRLHTMGISHDFIPDFKN